MSHCIRPATVRSPIAREVDTILRRTNHDALTYRMVILVEGITSAVNAFVTTLLPGADADTDANETAAEIVGVAEDEDTTDIVQSISDELDYLRAGCGRLGGGS